MEDNNNLNNEQSVVNEQPVVEVVKPEATIPETVSAEASVEQPKKKKKTPLLIIFVAVIFTLLGYVGGYYFGEAIFKKEKNKPVEQSEKKEETKKEETNKEEKKEEENKQEENKQEENKEENNKQEEKTTSSDVTVDDSMKKLIEKYAVDDIVEDLLAGKGYTLKDSKVVKFGFSVAIADQVKSTIEKDQKDYDGEIYVPASKARDTIKKAFDAYFGHVVEYSDAYYSGENVKKGDLVCIDLHYDKEKDAYQLMNYCGMGSGLMTGKLNKNITKAEKNGNNLYLYVELDFVGDDKALNKKANTKWSFVKQSDGNYYFSSVEIAK